MSDDKCLSDFSQLPGAGGSGERSGVLKTWNAPHIRLGEHFVDFYTEKYKVTGVVKKREAQDAIALRIQPVCKPYYGDIPNGVTKFSDKGHYGDILFYDGEELKVCNKSETNLAGAYRLPNGWVEVVGIYD